MKGLAAATAALCLANSIHLGLSFTTSPSFIRSTNVQSSALLPNVPGSSYTSLFALQQPNRRDRRANQSKKKNRSQANDKKIQEMAGQPELLLEPPESKNKLDPKSPPPPKKKKKKTRVKDGDDDVDAMRALMELQSQMKDDAIAEDRAIEDTYYNALDDEENAARGRVNSEDGSSDGIKRDQTSFSTQDAGDREFDEELLIRDVVTDEPVVLSSNPDVRMAQFSPGVEPRALERLRLDGFYTKGVLTGPQIAKAFEQACVTMVKNETSGEEFLDLPVHPAVTNEAVDFVVANRDLLGLRIERYLQRMKMRSQWKGNVEEARWNRRLWKHYLTLDRHISAPFRQILTDTEMIIGPNFGNLDVLAYADGPLVQRCACYLLLRTTVAHWTKKLTDAKFVVANPYEPLSTELDVNFIELFGKGGVPRKARDKMKSDNAAFVPTEATVRERERVVAMSLQMKNAFVEESSLFDDLPVELRFIEGALNIRNETERRQFMVETFCPQENITPEALRAGVRRLYIQFSRMIPDPYQEMTLELDELIDELSRGTAEDDTPFDEYVSNLDVNGPGFFQTYTFDQKKFSGERFMDEALKEMQEYNIVDDEEEADIFLTIREDVGEYGTETVNDISESIGSDFKLKKRRKKKKQPDIFDRLEEEYVIPDDRKLGRPMDLDWLNLLEEDEKRNFDVYESDNWREALDQGDMV